MSNERRHEQSSEFDYVGENMGATRNHTYNLSTLVGQWFERGQNYDYYSLTCQDEEDEEMNERRRRQEEDEADACQPYTQVRRAARRERERGLDVMSMLVSFDAPSASLLLSSSPPSLQLIWANTFKVGCGRYHCEELRGWDEEDEQDDGNDNDDDSGHLFICYYGPGCVWTRNTRHAHNSLQRHSACHQYVNTRPCLCVWTLRASPKVSKADKFLHTTNNYM